MEQILKIISEFTGSKFDEFKKKVLNDDGTPTEVADSYIKDLLSEKIKKVAFTDDKQKEIAENFEKKGRKETFTTVLTNLAELFPKSEITAEDKWEDAVKKVKGQNIEALPEDKIKLSEVYRNLEKNSIAKVEYEKLQGEFDGYKKSVKKGQFLNNMKTIVESKLADYRLPEDPKLKAKKIELMLNNTFADIDDFQPDGDDFLLLKDGKRLDDPANLNPITATRRITENIDLFFDRKEKGKPAGEPPAGTPPTPADKTAMPTSVEEFNKVRASLSGKELLEYNETATKHLKEKGLL